MQMVKITLRILHRPDEAHLSEIWQNYGIDYDERVLPSIGNEILKVCKVIFPLLLLLLLLLFNGFE